MLSLPIKLYLKLNHKIIKGSLIDPDYAQNTQLSLILQKISSTSFGIEHNISPNDTYAEFIKKVPVRTYEELVPYIERMLLGESNVLWPGMIKMFSKSSGTTNAASKYLPVSKESYYKCHHKGSKDMLTLYCNAYKDTKIFDGKSIGITGSLITNEKGITIGDISALMCYKTPWWAELMRIPKKEIALGEDWNKKSTTIAEICSNEDVRVLAGVPTWISVILEKVKNKTNKDNFWPNLELIAHGGVAFEPYRKLFKELLPNRNLNFWQSYNASEGFFATQDEKDTENMLLLLSNGVFYEFIPLSDFHKNDYTKIIPLMGVKIDTEYALIITTNSGLIRYNLGDTIKFTSLSPYKIVITGRTKFFLNAFGEEIVVDNVNKALIKAQEVTNSIVKSYTIGPTFMNTGSSGYHNWYVEFEKEPSSDLGFIEKIDKTLKEINSDYRAKRDGDTILGNPRIKSIPKGTFEKWLQIKNKLSPQSKVPPLYKDDTIIKELDIILNKKNKDSI